MRVIKRDERIENFECGKISRAIEGATNGIIKISKNDLAYMACDIENILYNKYGSEVEVEKVHDEVIEYLKSQSDKYAKCNIEKSKIFASLYHNYNVYRKDRDRAREIKSELMKAVRHIGLADHSTDNGNVGGNFSAKLLGIASTTNKESNLSLMPKQLSRLHEVGDLYYHDLDSYNLTVNCLHIPSRMLSQGFNTGYGNIKAPERIETGAELICILIQSVQNDQYGGVAIPDLEKMLSPIIPKTRMEIRNQIKFINPDISDEDLKEKENTILDARIRQSMQGIVYNLNTMHSRAGSQVPFSSINLGLPSNEDAAKLTKSFLEEYDKGLGGHQCIFPNILFAVKDGINAKEGDPYYYLYQLACKVAATKMNPTFMFLDATFHKKYYDQGYRPATMG